MPTLIPDSRRIFKARTMQDFRDLAAEFGLSSSEVYRRHKVMMDAYIGPLNMTIRIALTRR